MASSYWNQDRTRILAALWSDGLSASQIAEQLGDVTRNAVLGKIHRLGIQARQTPAKPATRPKVKRTYAIKEPGPAVIKSPTPPTPPPPSNDHWVKLMDRRPGQCCRPKSGVGADTFFCGTPTELELSYCAACRAEMYRPESLAKTKQRQKLADWMIKRYAA